MNFILQKKFSPKHSHFQLLETKSGVINIANPNKVESEKYFQKLKTATNILHSTMQKMPLTKYW